MECLLLRGVYYQLVRSALPAAKGCIACPFRGELPACESVVVLPACEGVMYCQLFIIVLLAG